MRRSESLFTAGIVLVGVVYEVLALRMPRGNLAYPGPGFYPVLVGVFLIACSSMCLAVTAWGAVRERRATAAAAGAEQGTSAAEAVVAEPAARRRTLQMLGALLFYALVLKSLGFVLAMSVTVFCSIRTFGYRRWLPSLGLTVVTVAVSYVLFVMWLKVPLPRGILG